MLDIRAAPVSRKKGFSKNQLAAHLAEAGIGYRHLRGLAPERGREAARGGDPKASSASSVSIWRSRRPPDLGGAITPAQAQPICLLCLDAIPSIVAARSWQSVWPRMGRLKHLFAELDDAQPGFSQRDFNGVTIEVRKP